MNYVMTKSGAKEPCYGSDGAAGIDIYYNGDEPVTIGPGAVDLEARGCGDGNIWVNTFGNIDY